MIIIFSLEHFSYVHVVMEKFDIWDVYIDCQTALHLHIFIIYLFILVPKSNMETNKKNISEGCNFSN